MDLAEIKTWLKENKDDEAVIKYLAGLSSLNSSKVKDFLTSDEDGKKLFNSLTDSAVTKAVKTGVETWKEKNLSGEVEKLHKIKFPDESAEAKGLREVTARLDASDEKIKKAALRMETLKMLGKSGLSPELLDRVIIGEDVEGVEANITSLKEILDSEVDKLVKKRFKDSGREVIIDDSSTKDTTLEQWKLKNPFTKDHFNLTLQGKIFKENRDLYERLKKLAAS